MEPLLRFQSREVWLAKPDAADAPQLDPNADPAKP
jgi:hypothetical protein